MFDVNHIALGRIRSHVEQARRMHAEDMEPTIERSGPKVWADVDADVATVDKLDLVDGPEPMGDPSRPVVWEQ
eukprot:1520505-Pyramimonas_sp.AAC.1